MIALLESPVKTIGCRASFFSRKALWRAVTAAAVLVASAWIGSSFLVHSAGAAHSAEVGLRLRFGIDDKESTVWDGIVAVTGGRIAQISGWRFTVEDKAHGVTAWKAVTHPIVLPRRANNPTREVERASGAITYLPISDNGVLLTLTDATENTEIAVKTAQGDFIFKLSQIPFGKLVFELKGRVEIERTAAAMPLTATPMDEDYPSAAIAPDRTAWIAYTSFNPGLNRDDRASNWQREPGDLSFLATAPGADQLWLCSVKGSEHGEPIALTPAGGDIYKSAVAVDHEGAIWVAWAQNCGYRPFPENPLPNFEIYARCLKDGKLSQVLKISDSPENDVSPVAAADSEGNVWIAWQGARDGVFRIFERHQAGGDWTPPRQVSTQTRSCWAPAIATLAKPNPRVAIAWDTYEKGDYDVWVREFAGTQPQPPRPVANSPDYEARPALTYDHGGALWVCWEQSGPTWGKNWGALDQSGIPLYRDRQIGLAILKDGHWQQPVGDLSKALPGAFVRRGQHNFRVPPMEEGGESRRVGEEAELRKDATFNNLGRIATDSAGRVWIFARTRQNDFTTPVGSLWLDWGAYTEGDHWVGPILVPHSGNLLYNTPVILPMEQGGLLIAHSTDHRQDRPVLPRRFGGGSGALGIRSDPFENDIYLSRVEVPTPAVPAVLRSSAHEPNPKAEPSPATLAERQQIASARHYRLNVEGKQFRILRGEFHRHTEISGDGGNDGPLEDMWRYAIDVAGMDWLGTGDHDNGTGREYPWWLEQKTTDAFHLPQHFNGLFTYERSVRFPEGHRNVIFTRRGIRTLSRLPITARDFIGHAPDTQMLYRYLRLFDGICASHSTATDMGTDWRDNDPVVEPIVEIYQGCRQNYERPGAPRSPSKDDAIGGWEPSGFVSVALQKGFRLGFESSSDHGSTHISYAMAIAEDNSRDAVMNALKQRHVYASTDNIIADVRFSADGREHLMGDEFTAHEPPRLSVRLRGTAPFAKVVIVKDDIEIQTLTPNQQCVDFTWIDSNPAPDHTSYYYIRGEQTNGELVWVSPNWVKYEPLRTASTR